ncbi:MAG: septal ring lytic transglycosylase RlpA family protein [Methylovulum sp.]|jgi:rare lipoprotein A|nr:septal ring lytic transglycosylase RlpA family protein [Methylovulum sp.]MCF7999042.1 septal ring lytic transglycosylase RlpA family protein [Methylovulum sp.]
MNKLISAISTIVLCSYFSNPISSAEAATKHSTHKHSSSKSHHRVIGVARHHSKHSAHRLVRHSHRVSDGKSGTASWYGNEFQGRKTANGERYDMYAMTAAHNSLPLSSYAEVTNIKNKRSVIVRINDRGPFRGNRVIDLSYAAAKELGIHDSGTGSIKVTPLVVNESVFSNNDHPG